MTMTMAEARAKRDSRATLYDSHGLHDYGSVRDARAVLQKSAIYHATIDQCIHANMAEWMWRNHASPEDAAIAFGLILPEE